MWFKGTESSIYVPLNILMMFISITIRWVTILDLSYHGYCGHKNSQYWYIAMSISNFGGGGYQSNNFLLCILSFSFSPNDHKDTDKRRAQDSGFLGLLLSSYEINYTQRQKTATQATFMLMSTTAPLVAQCHTFTKPTVHKIQLTPLK